MFFYPLSPQSRGVDPVESLDVPPGKSCSQSTYSPEKKAKKAALPVGVSGSTTRFVNLAQQITGSFPSVSIIEKRGTGKSGEYP